MVFTWMISVIGEDLARWVRWWRRGKVVGEAQEVDPSKLYKLLAKVSLGSAFTDFCFFIC